MLTIHTKGPKGQGLARRDFLRIGLLGSLGLSWPAYEQAHAGSSRSSSLPLSAGGRRGERRGSFGRAKRCILVFLNGGPSHLDLWDMKPGAPVEVRGELASIATNVPGIRVSELLPLTARCADKFKIVRSVTHNASVHTTAVYTMLTGSSHPTPNVDQTRIRSEDHPHLGAILARQRGWVGKLPPFVSLPTLFQAPPVDGIWPGQTAGFLGPRFDPLVVHGDKESARFDLPALELPAEVSAERLAARRALLSAVNRSFARSSAREPFSIHDDLNEQALGLMGASRLARAINLACEPAAVRQRYGRHLFGQGLLLARRLIEVEVPLVTVYWIDPTPPGEGGGEYDSHGRIYWHMRHRLVPPTDRGLSALVTDLGERGLLPDTLLVVAGEFGRSPRLNKQAGRDHWPQAQSILLAGAGISGGSVYGATDSWGAQPIDHPVTPPDLGQTILHLLGVPADFELNDRLGRPIPASRGTVLLDLIA
jgi:hypothetical protein